MDDKKAPPAVRATAASYVMDRVWGKARQQLEVDSKATFVFCEKPMSPLEWIREFGGDAAAALPALSSSAEH